MLDEQDADLDNLHQSTSPLLLVEIPDSQPSLKQVEISDSQPSFNQVEISDSQQARDSHERYLTHPKGFSGVHAHNDLNQIRDQLKLDFDNREAEPNQHKDHNSPGFVNEERAIPSGHHSDASPSEQRSRPSFQDQYVSHTLTPRLRCSSAKYAILRPSILIFGKEIFVGHRYMLSLYLEADISAFRSLCTN